MRANPNMKTEHEICYGLTHPFVPRDDPRFDLECVVVEFTSDNPDYSATTDRIVWEHNQWLHYPYDRVQGAGYRYEASLAEAASVRDLQARHAESIENIAQGRRDYDAKLEASLAALSEEQRFEYTHGRPMLPAETEAAHAHL